MAKLERARQKQIDRHNTALRAHRAQDRVELRAAIAEADELELPDMDSWLGE